jgi:hypothetical protein
MSFDGGVAQTKFVLGQVSEMSALNCRTDRAITGITTSGNVQGRGGIHVKLANGREGKDVQKVLPVAMCQLGRLDLITQTGATSWERLAIAVRGRCS